MPAPAPEANTLDHATYSSPSRIQTEHLHLDLAIDWPAQTLSGSVQHTMLVKKGGLDQIVLDVRDIAVRQVHVSEVEIKDWTVGERHEVLGSPLTIPLSSSPAEGSKLNVTVVYATSPSSSALGWLEAEQTKGGRFPYLYSQSQAIHARSLVPSQDTPGVKASYSAAIRSTLPVLMSARRLSPSAEAVHEEGKAVVYTYDQPVPIPSYLIAIASGNLAHRAFAEPESKTWRTGVWTEAKSLDAAHYEFSADTSRFIETAENITGRSYDPWSSYDVLVLPPAFPYGGMENPSLTFATPTIVAGDRSLVDVVAHEISHSWFGNLIGCATWSHFWLNESFTTYLERLIMRAAHGEGARGLSYTIGRKALQDSLKEYKASGQPRFMHLVVDYAAGEDPDDAFSTIPYDMGANLLLHLEQTLGGLDVFLPYIKSYTAAFAGQAITTQQWQDHLYAFWREAGGEDAVNKLDSIDWKSWLHGESTDLPVDLQYDSSLVDQAYDLAAAWTKASKTSTFGGFNKTDLSALITDQVVVFLEKLQVDRALTAEAVRALDDVYALSKSGNAEIIWRFWMIALDTGADYAKGAAAWVQTVGRMKFARSTFKALNKVDAALARSTFLAHAGFYHPIARRMIAKDLGVDL